MKLISSRIKDYYDHVAYQYGGGDPLNTYNRCRIGEMNTRCGSHFVEPKRVSMLEWKDLNSGFEQKTSYGTSDLDWLIVAGKPYPLVRAQEYPNKYEILDVEKHRELIRQTKSFPWLEKKSTPQGIQQDQLVELSKRVGHPVFIITNVHFNHQSKEYDFSIDGDYPILSNIGLPAIYPAEQLYQDLSYFLGNTMKASPDVTPPTAMSDEQKIVAAGFDKKVSFRHRN